jgi:hypothetical protein
VQSFYSIILVDIYLSHCFPTTFLSDDRVTFK